MKENHGERVQPVRQRGAGTPGSAWTGAPLDPFGSPGGGPPAAPWTTLGLHLELLCARGEEPWIQSALPVGVAEGGLWWRWR